MEIVNSYVPPKRSILPLEYKYIVNRSALCVIDRLLNRKPLNQICCNCGHSRLSNIIVEIRKFIGHEGIIDDKLKNENIKSVYYRLANNPTAKNKLLELKGIIEKRLFI